MSKTSLLAKFKTMSPRQLGGVVFVILFAVIGVYLLMGSHAATPYVSLNADQGTLSPTCATVQQNTSASDGKYVQFDAPNCSGSSSGGGGDSGGSSTKMFGLMGTYTTTTSTTLNGQMISFIQDAHTMGVQWVRVGMWGDTDEHDSGGVTSTATNLAAQGISMFPLVNSYSTSWVQPGTCSTSGDSYSECVTACSTPSYSGTCTDQLSWVHEIVYAAVTYAKGGTFWQGKTDYGSPVIEVANEPYICGTYGWPDDGCQQPGDYAVMVSLAAAAVNTATNGRIKLVASTIPLYTTSSGGTDSWEGDMAKAVPNIASEIGGIAVHPYGDIPSLNVCKTGTCNPLTDTNWAYPTNINTDHSDWPNQPVYVTEIGQKAASTTAGNGQVGYSGQCKAMNQYLTDFKNNSWEAGFFWYDQNDSTAYNASGDNGWALIDNTNYHKPAWYAYQAQATNAPAYGC